MVKFPQMSNPEGVHMKRDTNSIYYVLFFLSGFPALLYQIVWQRALFTLYGVNIESVTMIVTVFMLGLGMGSLAGGWLSSRPRMRLLLAFGLIEFSVGTFGAASLWIFHRIGAITAGASTLTTGLIAFALLLVPTMLMGSTLPLLVEHFVRRTGNVGESVGLLYSVNTLGSSAACFAAAFLLMRLLGESGSVRLAVCFNLVVGISAFILQVKFPAPARQKDNTKSTTPQQTIPFWIGMVLAGVTGFIALAYEIVWYRLYAFVSGGSAPCFAMLLAFYLLGIAYGSFSVRDACRHKLGNDVRRTLGATAGVVILGSITAFLLGPVLAHWAAHFDYHSSYVLVFVAAALLVGLPASRSCRHRSGPWLRKAHQLPLYEQHRRLELWAASWSASSSWMFGPLAPHRCCSLAWASPQLLFFAFLARPKMPKVPPSPAAWPVLL